MCHFLFFKSSKIIASINFKKFNLDIFGQDTRIAFRYRSMTNDSAILSESAVEKRSRPNSYVDLGTNSARFEIFVFVFHASRPCLTRRGRRHRLRR